MRRRVFIGVCILALGVCINGCGDMKQEQLQDEIEITETSKEEPQIIEEIEEEKSVDENELENLHKKITSGMGAIYDGKLYYAIAGGGCHTGIICRDMTTGSETEVVSNRNTNGFSSLSIYDGYIYCVWDKYVGTDDSDSYIYRFSLTDFTGEELVKGNRPIVVNNNVYFWNKEWYEYADGELPTLYAYNIDSKDVTEVGKFEGPTFGIENGYGYNGIYDYFYYDEKIYIEVEYEELGEYDENVGGYLWKEDAERGVELYDLQGNTLDQSDFDIEYVSYYTDGEPYGVEHITQLTDVGEGKLVIGYSGGNEVCNYISVDGDIIKLQSWMPAE